MTENVQNKTISLKINRLYKNKITPPSQSAEMIPISDCAKIASKNGWSITDNNVHWAIKTGSLKPVDNMVMESDLLSWCQWRHFNSTFEAETLTVREWMISVYRGYAFHPLTDGRRKKDKFLSSCYIALDYDTCDYLSSLDHLKTEKYSKYATFGYTSPSHTDECPRARLVWVLDTPITDYNRLESLTQALMQKYVQVVGLSEIDLTDVCEPYCDTSTKDCIRLFYGSEKCEVWANWGTLPDSVVDELIAEHEAKIKAENEAKMALRGEMIKPVDVSDKLVSAILDGVLDNIKTVQKGSIHNTVNRISFVMGGYVSGGYISRSEAEQMVENAIHGNGGINSPEMHIRTSIQAITDGMREPIAITEYDNGYKSNGGGNVKVTTKRTKIIDLNTHPDDW